MKSIRYRLEYFLLRLLMGVFSRFSPDKASALGGWLGRTIGPWLAASRKARRHLELSFPGLSDERYRQIIIGMWDNLGRVIAEYPHIQSLACTRTEIVGQDHLLKPYQAGRGLICLGAHSGNWELPSMAATMQLNLPIEITYRAPNNPWVDDLLMRYRTIEGQIEAHSKSRAGGRNMIETIKGGGVLAIMVDQKYNEGPIIPFFGRPAPTNVFFAQLAQKYGAALVPALFERLEGAHFRLTLLEPMDIRNKSPEDIAAEMHKHLEQWIARKPEQWLWLHRRWKD